LIYKVNSAARPRWLRGILHPLMRAIFAWETRNCRKWREVKVKQ
jgi:hypothetical protein